MVDSTNLPDPQDPLPESNWLYRRWCLLGSLVFMWLVVAWNVYHGQPIDRWVWYCSLTILVLYTVAPSAEQITKMIATVSLLKPGNLALQKDSSTTTSAAGVTTTQASSSIQPAAPAQPVVAADAAEPANAGELPASMKVQRP